MSIALREYQTASIDAVIEARNKEAITRPLICLPTGTGKTVIFASLAKRMQAKTLIIAHRDELLRQAQDKVRMIWPNARTGIIKAQENDFQDKDVVIASIQTLCREKRLNQVASEDFSLCIVDEAHHSVGRTYRDTISYLGFMDDDPARLLLGVTATTKRLDKLGLKNVFQKIVYESSILTMVRGGFLSDIRGYRTDTGVDLTTIKTRQGDFVEAELSFMVNTPERNEKVVESYIEHAGGRKALAFTVGVQHAHDLAEVFSVHSIEAVAISGKTSGDERKEILQAFSAGEIRVLCNCNLLTEGYDEPSIDCILLARPTKSATLYTQMVGRGTRRYQGKVDCIVIDFTDKSHDVCALPSLLGKDLKDGQSILEEEEEEEKKKEKGEQERDWTDRQKPIGKIEEFDLLGKSKFQWFFYGTEWRLPISSDCYLSVHPTNTTDLFFARIIKKDDNQAGANLIHPTPLDFGYAQGVCEDYARRHGNFFANKEAEWRKNPPSDKQVELLKKIGINPEGLSKGDASEKIGQFFASRQARKVAPGSFSQMNKDRTISESRRKSLFDYDNEL